MQMGTPHSRCRFLLAGVPSLWASSIKPLLSLILMALLVTAPASPQSPGGAAAPSAFSSGKAPETSPPRADKNRAQNAYQSGRRAEQTGDGKGAYPAIPRGTPHPR